MNVQRRHAMPFGAEFCSDNTVRFRLWAPGISSIELLIDEETPIRMQRSQTGWFEHKSHKANPGSRYCYRLDSGLCVPDPASRFNPQDVHAASQVIDPGAFEWQDKDWRGRPWEQAVIYELHVGTFTPEGNFAGVIQKLDYLLELGITAIELMPVADFPGHHNWGYDGALLFAPDSIYGTPDELKLLVQEAHHRGMMVLLDVVYNHFGPEGNYLHLYAPQFFTERHHTPWGAAINFDGEASRTVRDFYIHNACYWLEEYHLDGLRLDAVHAILDDSRPDILDELALEVHKRVGNGRHIHLVLENDHNAAHYLTRSESGRALRYVAQWNDDIHHAFHTLMTAEHDGYYCDYADEPLRHLGRCLSEGFAYQGERSLYRHGERRGEYSAHLPSSAFVSFLQNHDQIGNRAFGERLSLLASPEALHAATVLLLLAPSPPLLFMGQEWGAREPFPFFCDFGADIAPHVTSGRRNEFARFEQFSDATTREAIPDPCALQTFESARLDWSVTAQTPHREWFALHRELLALRHRLIIPHLRDTHGNGFQLLSSHALRVEWWLGSNQRLTVYANLGAEEVELIRPPSGALLYCTSDQHGSALASGRLLGFAVAWYLEKGDAHT